MSETLTIDDIWNELQVEDNLGRMEFSLYEGKYKFWVDKGKGFMRNALTAEKVAMMPFAGKDGTMIADRVGKPSIANQKQIAQNQTVNNSIKTDIHINGDQNPKQTAEQVRKVVENQILVSTNTIKKRVPRAAGLVGE